MSISKASQNPNDIVDVRHPLDRPHLSTHISTPSKTMQSFVEESTISNIYERFTRSGMLPPATREPQYGDVSHLNRDLTELHAETQQTIATVNTRAPVYADQVKKARSRKPTPPPEGGGNAPPSSAPPVPPA